MQSEIPLPSDGFLFNLLEPWDVRALSIRKIADLPLQLWVGTFPRFVAIGILFSIRNHQSFFYSFTTILPSESGVYTLDYSTILPQTPSFRHLTFIFEHLSHDFRENYDYRNVSWEMISIYDLTMSKMRGGKNVTHALSEARG